MDTLVLKIAYGGLGDHLFYSPLPRIAKQTGAYTRVLISNHSDFRSSAYRSLIWEANPYVDGFTDEDAAAPVLGSVRRGHNLLDTVMLAMGLDDGIRMHEPELYFTPTLKPELATSIVYDPNFVSYVGNIADGDVNRYFTAAGLSPTVMLTLRGKAFPYTLTPVQELQTQSFEDYCSVIASAKQFICLSSGSATLASALRKPSVVLWGAGQNPIFHHSPTHTYRNVHPGFGQRRLPAIAGPLSTAWWTLKANVSRNLAVARRATQR